MTLETYAQNSCKVHQNKRLRPNCTFKRLCHPYNYSDPMLYLPSRTLYCNVTAILLLQCSRQISCHVSRFLRRSLRVDLFLTGMSAVRIPAELTSDCQRREGRRSPANRGFRLANNAAMPPANYSATTRAIRHASTSRRRRHNPGPDGESRRGGSCVNAISRIPRANERGRACLSILIDLRRSSIFQRTYRPRHDATRRLIANLG